MTNYKKNMPMKSYYRCSYERPFQSLFTLNVESAIFQLKQKIRKAIVERDITKITPIHWN
ncbi:unnamed protein product [Nezara viridula]|uniref:Uncharacterized protein n=1 Tax=Nezara viridula TaxID=85310 RepID=A0A9P0HTL1_NEZVI|nr:unnamed protein product [Nezara viridula]